MKPERRLFSERRISSGLRTRREQNRIYSRPSKRMPPLLSWTGPWSSSNWNREKQSEWFGKRGINWHVSSVITRNAEDNGLEIMSYVHLFESCAQDWYTVCAILENLLGNIRQIKPTVNEVFLRSDGAGCCHNNNLIAAASNVGTSVGIKVIR